MDGVRQEHTYVLQEVTVRALRETGLINGACEKMLYVMGTKNNVYLEPGAIMCCIGCLI